jgi:2-dehydropantoate 2-reductase
VKQTNSILLIGLGSIGSVLFSRLTRKKHKVVCVTSLRSAKLIRRKGIRVQLTTDVSPQLHNCEVYTEIPEKYVFEKCIISTKSWINETLVDDLKKWLTPDASLILFQNGLHIEKPFLSLENDWKITRVITSLAALRKEKNHAIEASIGDTFIGSMNYEDQEEIEDITKLLSGIGLSVEVSESIQKHIWLKTITNSSIGPLSAITGLLNGDVLSDSFLNGIIQSLINEILLIAPEELDVKYEEAYKLIERIVGQTATHKSSMLQDIENNTKTEMSTLNGEIVRIAEDKGIEVPTNKKLVELINKISNENFPKELAVLELRSIY